MDPVQAQYEAYPYPERDPAQEASRLITGSPSALHEIDHYLFGGTRDWRRLFRALVAGGGTGDGLIQLAQGLADLGCPAEITYLDLSHASREIAEARARARGLSCITFLTGDLTDPPEGPFDYIDCCGVLHHLPDPQRGFDALARVLSPEGGMGLMVYAPHGRTGVYPLQEAFATLLADDAPESRVATARAVLETLPETNWFLRNTQLSDHRASDAGLYDLLLHARDRPFSIEALDAALVAAGLGLVSPVEPARYDPARCLPDTPQMAARLKTLSSPARMGLAERLSGDLRMHIVYAAPAARAKTAMAKPTAEAVPRLNGLPATALARTVEKQGGIDIAYSGVTHRVRIPRKAAPLIAAIGGRPLGAIAGAARLDWFAFMQLWGPVHRGLTGYNRLHYTRIR
ncbi:MAG: class I SAM-dependent methyltransferase [Pseudomonadota bacterium]